MHYLIRSNQFYWLVNLEIQLYKWMVKMPLFLHRYFVYNGIDECIYDILSAYCKLAQNGLGCVKVLFDVQAQFNASF